MKTPAQELGDALAKDLNTMSDKAQSDVAEALDVSQQTISNWVTGKHLPRPEKLVKLHGVFGEGSQTAKVVEHIQPRLFFTFHSSNLKATTALTNFSRDPADLSTEEQTKRYKGNMRKVRAALHNVGNMSAGPSGPPPPMDTDDLPTHMATEHHIPYSIESFERQRDALSQQELHDALSRAVKGVDLARQVLDDASVQLARAMQQLEKT